MPRMSSSEEDDGVVRSPMLSSTETPPFSLFRNRCRPATAVVAVAVAAAEELFESEVNEPRMKGKGESAWIKGAEKSKQCKQKQQ